MDLNSNRNIVNKLSNLSDEQLENVEIKMSLVRKQKNADHYYQAKEINLKPDVVEWLKKHIARSLRELKETDENITSVFSVSDYNLEVEKSGTIARYDISVNDSLADKKQQLFNALSGTDAEFPDKQTNFQFVRLDYDGDSAYFCFYKGTRKNTKRRKFATRNANEFKFFEDTLIDIGGNIDFFIIGNFIFIINVNSFEYAFDYRDHINQLRDENLERITSMPFFNDENSNGEAFKDSCKAFVYSRSLAQIKPETLNVLQENFEERCNELAAIEQNKPANPAELEEYKEKFSTVWPLLEFIDTENYKVIYKEGEKPTPLIHFFADKIVKSFLSSDFRVAIAYDS
ncbi:Kiwa anti-phage protein KwaB-like domain-containing protein [Sediminibacillus halophilus]|uniref:DUF4868 domain-containing protein n=1 Tax=Sediminibacillus halophilus TaxID=482461 RepID=A0A1G9QXR2_9BACI|nr:Kiwa anti-phage protein KwaB-like domain-containing protein [Sediminibacillus halophilus]SDM15035.1 protein of unknown function [Sediminibacillus halophilus]